MTVITSNNHCRLSSRSELSTIHYLYQLSNLPARHSLFVTGGLMLPSQSLERVCLQMELGARSGVYPSDLHLTITDGSMVQSFVVQFGYIENSIFCVQK